MTTLVPIVEGHSEVEAVPLLLRRLLADARRSNIQIARPIRTGRYKIVRPGELERAFQYARLRPEGCDAILLLLDADDEPPCELGPRLLMQAQQVSADLPCKVVIANREFESWFLGSIESLRGQRGIAQDAVSLDHPEMPRDAKGHLTRLMTAGRTYVEVDDQPSFAASFDMQAARNNCPSFDKLVRDLQALLEQL
ncbi:MAG: DUF4276 family protein [candidate division KSB1 bacterium]